MRYHVDDGRVAYAIGMNGDQNAVAPDVILGSAVIRIPEAFLSTARRWQAEGVGGAPIYVNTEQDVIDFVFNPELIDRVPAEAIERVAATSTTFARSGCAASRCCAVVVPECITPATKTRRVR